MTYQAHPLRVQLSRKKGARKPHDALVVSRPSLWGNPFVVVPPKVVHEQMPLGWTFEVAIRPYQSHGRFASGEAAVDMYRFWLKHSPEAAKLREMLKFLRGRQLCCWCALDKPCHADVLAELANR